MKAACTWCDTPLTAQQSAGRPPEYCSPACKREAKNKRARESRSELRRFRALNADLFEQFPPAATHARAPAPRPTSDACSAPAPKKRRRLFHVPEEARS